MATTPQREPDRKLMTVIALLPLILVLIAIVALLFSNGSKGNTQAGGPAATGSATGNTSNTSNTSNSGGPTVLTQCSTLPDFQHAPYINIADTDFLGVGTANIVTTGQYQVAQYQLCAPTVAPSQANGVSAIVRVPGTPTQEAIHILNLDGRGWLTSQTFPLDGNDLAPCPSSALCFGTYGSYLLLEHAEDRGNGLYTFQVLIATTPPPLVSCDPAAFPYDVYVPETSLFGNSQIPLPPFTRTGQQWGDGATDITLPLCSAGTIASIKAFMQENLPKYNWEPITVNGHQIWETPPAHCPTVSPGNSTSCTPGTPLLYLRITLTNDPTNWSVTVFWSA